MLQLLDLCVFKDHAEFQALVKIAREQLDTIRNKPSPSPPSDSPALLSFDPFVASRLNAFIPLRVLNMRSIPQTWDAVDTLLNGLAKLWVLSTTTNISTWVVG